MERAELRPIDQHFAALLQRIAARPSEELFLAARLVSRSQADGHVCLPLREVTDETLVSAGIEQRLPAIETWREKLCESGVVGREGEFQPLILDRADRLYLQRYWTYEDEVGRDLVSRLRSPILVEETKLNEELVRIFSHESQLQKLAGFVAATSNLCV